MRLPHTVSRATKRCTPLSTSSLAHAWWRARFSRWDCWVAAVRGRVVAELCISARHEEALAQHRSESAKEKEDLEGAVAVSDTHLTLPTNRQE